MERKFYLKSSTDLQRIGLRTQILSYLVEQGFERGNIINNPDDKREVIVALAARDVSEIKETRDGLVKRLNQLHDEDPICYAQAPTDITASDLFLIDNPHGGLAFLEFGKLSDSFMLEQTSKGTGALLSLSNAIKSLSLMTETSFINLEKTNTSLLNAIKELRETIAKKK